MRGGRGVLAVGLLLGATVVGPAGSATYDVPCSADALQDAVNEAASTQADDLLRLAAPCVYTLSAPLAVPDTGGQLTLRGGAGTVLDGGMKRQLLIVYQEATASVERLVFRDGMGQFDGAQSRGGAIRNFGTLRVSDSTFVGNDGGRVGGAIDSTIGSLTVVRSLFTDNRSENGGAIYVEGALTVVSSTFTGNSAPRGSAILSFATGTVSSSTIVGNDGQALHQDTNQLSVVNTVLARNPRNCAITGTGSLLDLGGNVEDQAGTCTWSEPTSRAGIDPVLLPLADNGGATQTFAPGPGSPLLDSGARCSEGGPAIFDQRLRRRPATGCDIGAVESSAAGSLSGTGDFGTVASGRAARRSFTLRSSGSDLLVVGDVGVTGEGYAVVGDQCRGRRLAAGQSCTVVVELRPARSGSAPGQLTVVDNADPTPRGVPLTGTGSAALPSGRPSITPTDLTTASPTASPTGASGEPSPPAEAIDGPDRVVLGEGETVLVSTRRARFPQALPLPNQVSLELDDLARSTWLAALLLALLALPVGLVNATLEAHREELAERFATVRRRLGRLRLSERTYAGLSLRVAAPATALVSGAIYAFLDPGVGADRESAASILGLVITVVLATLVTRHSQVAFLRRAYQVRATFRLFPGFIALALACTLVSRVTGLQPGLVLGTVLGVQLSRDLHTREEGRAVAAAYGALGVVSVAAWFAWVPVARAAAGAAPSFVVLVLDVVLAATFVIGVEALAFGLVPLRWLDGEPLWQWSKQAWLGLAGLGMFGFVHVVLHPTDSALEFIGRERYLAVLLAAYVLAAGGFWAYFRYRRRPAPA